MNNPYTEMKWEDLQQAYGPATLTPQYIDGLVDPDKKTRDHSLSQLFMSIWHQGTIYSATIKAIPQIIEIAKTTPYEKDDVVALLASLVSGEGYFRVHAQYIDEREAEILKKEHGIIISDEIQKENSIIAIAREYAIICLPIFKEFIQSNSSNTRECVAMAIGVIPVDKNEAIALLETMRINELDESVLHYIDEGVKNIRNRA